jgi:hypothetical protein
MARRHFAYASIVPPGNSRGSLVVQELVTTPPREADHPERSEPEMRRAMFTPSDTHFYAPTRQVDTGVEQLHQYCG